jgi:hypothetical protein
MGSSLKGLLKMAANPPLFSQMGYFATIYKVTAVDEE